LWQRRNKGGGKDVTSELFQIDVRQLYRQGRLLTDQFLIVHWVQQSHIAAAVSAQSEGNRVEFT
jgi:hypothetical protein